MMHIHIESKYFDQKAIIEDFRLQIKPREILALIGPSGAGKSTLLSIIGGLDSDYKGDIHCTDNNHHRIGMMFQEARLMPWMTVVDNVHLVAQEGTPKSAAIHLLQQVGMGDFLNAYPNQLSGGQSRRVALARAFMYQPDMLLMDEPFSSLDAPSAQALRHQLLALKSTRPMSIIYVTHDLKEAITIADSVCILSHSPMTLLHSEPIHLDRPRHINDSAVDACSQRLARQFPALLSGQPTNPMLAGGAS